jgi:hypothetical protein
MNAQAIRELGLTVADLDLVIEALDILPQGKSTQKFVMTLMTSMSGDPGKMKEAMQKERMKLDQNIREATALKEEADLVKSVFIRMKRVLIADDLKRQTDEALNRDGK